MHDLPTPPLSSKELVDLLSDHSASDLRNALLWMAGYLGGLYDTNQAPAPVREVFENAFSTDRVKWTTPKRSLR